MSNAVDQRNEYDMLTRFAYECRLSVAAGNSEKLKGVEGQLAYQNAVQEHILMALLDIRESLLLISRSMP